MLDSLAFDPPVGSLDPIFRLAPEAAKMKREWARVARTCWKRQSKIANGATTWRESPKIQNSKNLPSSELTSRPRRKAFLSPKTERLRKFVRQTNFSRVSNDRQNRRYGFPLYTGEFLDDASREKNSARKNSSFKSWFGERSYGARIR